MTEGISLEIKTCGGMLACPYAERLLTGLPSKLGLLIYSVVADKGLLEGTLSARFSA